MCRVVVLELQLLFCIFTTNGKTKLRETESTYEQLSEVDRLPEGTLIEDSSGGKTSWSIAITRGFFYPGLEALK